MILDLATACVALSLAVGLYRVLRGPNWGDRITAFDFLTVGVAVLIVLFAVRTGSTSFLDAALLVSILGFLSTVALTRYLLKGRVIE